MIPFLSLLSSKTDVSLCCYPLFSSSQWISSTLNPISEIICYNLLYLPFWTLYYTKIQKRSQYLKQRFFTIFLKLGTYFRGNCHFSQALYCHQQYCGRSRHQTEQLTKIRLFHYDCTNFQVPIIILHNN